LPRERLTYLAFWLVGVVLSWAAFRAIGAGFPVTHWWYYWADAWIFVGSMVATFAMARGWVDFWLCWLAVDIVGVPELLYFKFYPSAVLYGVYGAFVIWGFVAWLRIAQAESASLSRPPRPDEVPA
jgi:nicotinamide mononucleotide transporter